LLEICTPLCTKISGYQLDIRGTMNGYQEKIDQISIKYLTNLRIILKKYLQDVPEY